MTDELAGGAAAPAEAVSTPEIQNNVPEPITETTPRGAIDRAFEAVESGEAKQPASKPVEKAEPVAAKPETTGERARNPDGTFAAAEPGAEQAKPTDPLATQPKPETGVGEAPTRFSADAKAAWKDAPEPVKAEVARMERELTAGMEKYRADATTYNETFKPFVDLAIQSRMDPKSTLQNYIGIDQLLARDFDAGIAQIFQNKGQDVRAWAAKLAGQPAPTPVPQDQTIAELRKEIADLRQGFTGVSQTIEQQRATGINQSLESFTKALPTDADRTLFNELDGEIARYLSADPSMTLADAFAKAKQDDADRYARRYGAPASSAPAPAAVAPTPPAPTPQTRAGQLQISGAPGSGSNPVSRPTPSSPRAALDDAFASLGIG